VLPTNRLSPKNQVTLPGDARTFGGGDLPKQLHGLPHGMTSDRGETFPVLVIMSDSELRRREQKILDDARLTGEQKLNLVTRLNGGLATMAVDAQHRVVLPPHVVAHLKVDRDVFLVATNTTIQVWNPDHYRRWAGLDGETPAVNPALSEYLAI